MIIFRHYITRILRTKSLVKLVSCSACFLATQFTDARPTTNIPSGNIVKEISKSSPKNKSAFLPIPIPVSDPTLGSGLMGALLYLHSPKNNDSEGTPTATTGVGAMYTDSESKGIAVFHDNYLKDDKYRFKLVAATGDINLDFYGIGSVSLDDKYSYNIKPVAVFSQFLIRLPNTDKNYLGVRYLYTKARIKFDLFQGSWTDSFEFEIPEIEFDTVTSSLGIDYNYDSRNNNFYPTDGIKIQTYVTKDNDTIGSDFEFKHFYSNYRQYFPFNNKSTLAIKAGLSDIDGRAPFFLQSSLEMRGFSSLRYLDNTSLTAAIEWRYKFSERFGFVTFVENGKIGADLSRLFDSNSISSIGLGLRWQPTASNKINLSLDYAKSTDDSAVHLRVGEAF